MGAFKSGNPGCCCGPIANCNGATWPDPLYITVGGTTYTLAFQAGGIYAGYWAVLTTVPASAFTNACAPASSMQIEIYVRCSGALGSPPNALKVAYDFSATAGACAGGCYLLSTLGAAKLINRATVTTFSNSPVAGTGSFDGAAQGCIFGVGATINGPLDGQAWTLSE